MTITSITAAVTGAYTLAKQIRRTWWHACVEMMRGNLQRKNYPGFEVKNEKKTPAPSDDGPPCGEC